MSSEKHPTTSSMTAYEWQRMPRFKQRQPAQKPANGEVFRQLCLKSNLPAPIAEYRFAPPRRWRIDYFFHDERTGKKVALEVEGGVWQNGRHTRGSGFVKDMEKYNTLATMGIVLVRVQPRELLTISTITTIQKALTNDA